MIVPDHYRYPTAWMGWMGTRRVSALDAAEVEMGRDRNFPQLDKRARLEPEDAQRLQAREERASEMITRRRRLRELLDQALPA